MGSKPRPHLGDAGVSFLDQNRPENMQVVLIGGSKLPLCVGVMDG